MTFERMLRERVETYGPGNSLDQENVIVECLQSFVLVHLAGAGLFGSAMFHGGTCLRIIHRLPRFSEDLDFLLKRPEPKFQWRPYLDHVHQHCELDGIDLELIDRSEAPGSVRKAFLKTDSIGKLFEARLPHSRDPRRKVRIKLEIDVNPPAGSSLETHYLRFPTVAAITVQSLESGLGTKLHALLCRGYAKGRDWYDFLWFVHRRIRPDFVVLANAIRQVGPWAGRTVEVDEDWLLSRLRDRVDQIDWEQCRTDVARFLPEAERAGIDLWDTAYFAHHIDLLGRSFQG